MVDMERSMTESLTLRNNKIYRSLAGKADSRKGHPAGWPFLLSKLSTGQGCVGTS